jgi:hypothetical protein
MLCETCLKINFKHLNQWDNVGHIIADKRNVVFEGDESYSSYYFHKPTIVELQLSMSSCHFCAVLWHAFVQPPDSWNASYWDLNTTSRHPIILQIWRFGVESRTDRNQPPNEPIWAYHGSQRAQLEFALNMSGLYYISLLVVCRRVLTFADPFANMSQSVSKNWASGSLLDCDASTGSFTNMELAREWYMRCNRNHPQCQRDATKLPTRVIDARKLDEGGDPTLYETLPSTTGEYVALSHCWGGALPLEPTGSVVNGHQTLPPLSKWPKTFQDSIQVAKACGIHYLWIDTLCIRQHDEQDWTVEASRMAEYFGNAAFTIAAVGAADGTQGCFWMRNPLLTRPCQVPFRFEGDRCSENLPQLFYIVARPPLGADLTEEREAPLHSRVWVLQEELLARRILRFGKRQMYWNCLTHEASESFPGGGLPTERNNLRRLLQNGHIDVERSGTRNPFYDEWYKLVNTVNARNITFNKDILPAISAIAKSIHCYMDDGDRYLAGLWEKDLLVGLLWVVPRGESSRPEVPDERLNYCRKDFTAPSWSWISMSHKELSIWLSRRIVPGGVNNKSNYTDPSRGTQILSAEVELKNEVNPYGEVKRGALKFRAQLCPIMIKNKLSRRETYRGSHERLFISTFTWKAITTSIPHLRYPPHDSRNPRLVTGECELDDDDYAPLHWWSFLSPRDQDHCIQAKFLPLLVHDNDNSYSPNRFMGLALVSTENRNEFKRIGRVSLDFDAIDYTVSRLPFEEITVV